MPFGVSIYDSFCALVRNYRGVSCDAMGNRGCEAVDRISKVETVDSQPQKKRRKVQKSLHVNSEYVAKIVSWLANDKITTVGIYGMGGIGKTTLAVQLHSWIQDHAIHSVGIHDIAWVYVEMDFTCILFIDNLWGDFRREDVGIPCQCRLVLITRLLDVCRRLHCQKIVKVEALSEEENWQLFHHSTECGVSSLNELSSIRKLVYKECAGLPLAVTVLANTIKGVVNPFMGPTQLDDVFNRLKPSYERLNNVKLQRSFLFAALYPKGYAIHKKELIWLWIGQGIIDEVPSLQAQYDMGHTMLNKLLNSCLLETCQDQRVVKMHDLVRRMALSIARDNFMVETGVTSKMEFSGNLHAISLIKSSISLIPSGNFLKFANLSTLYLQNNPIEVIPESFFLQMRTLHVLSLSATHIIRLPSSIGALEELQVLDLSSCQKLKEVPQLAKLHNLRFLDLSQTAVEKVPRSLEMLKKLTELDLSSVLEPKRVPNGVLSALSRLKRLSCHVLGVIHELQNLKSLEILDAKFENLFDLSVYVKSEHWRTLECFHLEVGHQIRPKRFYNRGVSLNGCTLSGQEAEQFVLPYDIWELYLDDCSGFSSLSEIIISTNAYGFQQEAEAFSSLEICHVSRCNDVEQLLSPGWMPYLQCLEILEVEECLQLKELMPEDVNLPQLKQLVLTSLPQLNSVYKGQLVCASLQSLTVMECPNLKRLPFFYMEDQLVPSGLEWIEGQHKWWESLEWDKPKSKALLKPFFRCSSVTDV
ncbi:hypothetical protein BVRB_7g168690 [Beta vulgaris subsp. vulgaris]|nr:hypothetical protein BVRB_7g168690 [Beta vulgaris subsp. vulgaris]